MEAARKWCALSGLVAALAGCADVDVDASEDDLTALSLKLDGTGASLTVNDSPKLKSGAQGALACKDRFDADGRVRLACTRSGELLEVIVADGKARLVDWPTGRGSDKRAFFACTPSGKRPDGLPAKLDCKSVKLGDQSGGGLVSPFDSTVAGVAIPNTHTVGTSADLLRGMAPRSAADYDQLLAAKVAAVIVFKNQTGTGHDVADEIAELQKRGLAAANAINIPFKWKEMGPFKESCEQTVQALKFIKTNLAAKRKTFFHCTVGEDRTGYLAAVQRLVGEGGLDPAKAWDVEMCERGYGAGNPLKPAFVVATLDGSLGPLYRKMAWLVASGRLTASLDPAACAKDPETDPKFASTALAQDRLTCGTSTRFQP